MSACDRTTRKTDVARGRSTYDKESKAENALGKWIKKQREES